MDAILSICIAGSLLSLNVLLWVLCYVKYLKPPERGRDEAKIDLKESDEENIEKEKLAKEWANMMNYNGIIKGGD